MLCRTPSVLVGLALDDLAGETEPVNVPGVPLELFPSWSRKMRNTLEIIAARPETARTIASGNRHAVRDA
jgi:4-alpha-glucanotransferase